MSRLIEALKVLLLATWLLISLGLGWWMLQERITVETTLRDVHTTVLEAGLTLKNLREASLEWKKASQTQASQTSQAMSNVSAAAKQLTFLVSRTDESINSYLIPSLTKAITEQSASLSISQVALRDNLSQMLQATAALQKTLVDADSVIADPAIKVSLDNLSEATQQSNVAMEHLSGITAAGQRTAEYYEHRLTTPQSFFKTLVQFVLQAGSQARILFAK